MIGKIILYTQTVNSTLFIALGTLGSAQAKVTQKTMRAENLASNY